MREVLLKMSGFLSVGNGKNDGEVLQIVKEKLKAAREYVRLESENHLTSEITYDEQYFEMRRDQTKLLEIMAVNLNEFRWDGEEMAILSEMFKQTAEQLAEQNKMIENLDKENLVEKIKDLELKVKEIDLKIEEAKKEVKMLENNKENLTDLLDLYTRQLEYGKKDFKLRGSEK